MTDNQPEQQNQSKIRSILKDIGFSLVWVWSAVSKLIGSLVLVLLILVIILVGTISRQYQDMEQFDSRVIKQGGEEQVAVVRLNGEILQYAEEGVLNFNPFVITPTRTQQLFSFLQKDPDVKSVVLMINSPGGSVVASEEIYQQIKELNNSKPVIASLGDVAASGGYYIATPATKIVANQASLTGSVGVIAFSPNASGLYEKLGLAVNTYKTGEFKDMGSPHRDETEQEQEILQQVLDDSFDLFLKRIREERSVNETQLKMAADGRVLSGKQALELGLVDELGFSSSATELAIKESGASNPSIVEYSYGSGLFFNFMSSSLGNLTGVSGADSLMPPKMGVYFLWQQ